MTSIPLARAVVCLNEETVFDLAEGMTCPRCGSELFHPLSAWLNPMEVTR